MNYMASEYQGDAMMYRSKANDVHIERASNNSFDDSESVPNRFCLHPFDSENLNLCSGDIFVTPDKSNFGYKQIKRNVTFKEDVDVQLLSPTESLSLSPQSNVTKARNIKSTKPSIPEAQLKSIRAMPIRRCESVESVNSSDVTQESDGSIETVDVIAKDDLVLPPTSDFPEHPLARPEFSSILDLKRHRLTLETEELNVKKAVSEKLKSTKTRTKLNDVAYRKLNREDAMFSSLPATDVQEERIALTEKVLANRVSYKAVKRQPAKAASREQDIFDLFKPEFQKQTANTSVLSPDKIIAETPRNKTTDERRETFQVYKHIRSWEGLDN